MSWRDAPLYVRCHDLARWLLERCAAPAMPAAPGDVLAGDVQVLLSAVSLALTFPAERAEHLARADRAAVRLRVTLRLARDLGGLSAGAHRYAAGELDQIGRMLGGWRKRWRKKARAFTAT
ncbi:MAG: four helix bundle protein [Alphaproteobacteria bacterium]|nr:four helix bundle protein [Alphaproteobacteria bacterium]